MPKLLQWREMVFIDASGPLVIDSEQLGRIVREARVRWAKEQPNPERSWLVPWDELGESDREADRRIGESVCRATMLAVASTAGSPIHNNWPEFRPNQQSKPSSPDGEQEILIDKFSCNLLK